MRAREIIKGFSLLPIVLGVGLSMFAWGLGASWTYRALGAALLGLGLVVFLRAHFMPDRAPDYLGALFGTYFDRDGFCFNLVAVASLDQPFLRIFFQSRYEGASTCRLVLRPSVGWLSSTRDSQLSDATTTFDCPSGGFGFIDVALPFSPRKDSPHFTFQVGASVEYSEPRGRTLRFRDGIVVRTNSDFGDTFRDAVAVGGALTGSVILTSPATVTIKIPTRPSDVEPRKGTTVLWRLGDDLLQDSELATLRPSAG